MNIENPRLLDLFCGAGGCSVGYHRAGFLVTGVDISPQRKYYPFDFFQHDALDYLDRHGHLFDVIHASPPCQGFSGSRSIHGKDFPDLLRPLRRMLLTLGKPWVIENVPGAPMYGNTVTVCGLSLGLNVKRHRLFQSSVPLVGTTCPAGHPGDWITVFGLTSSIGYKRGKGERARNLLKHERLSMGIDWMPKPRLSQAIPPPYTEYIGRQILQSL